MTSPDQDPAGIVAHAHETRVVVIGGGLAGLTAALECARIGMPVTVLEAQPRLGGDVVSADVEGVRVDLVADSFALGQGQLAALIDDLGLADAVEPAAADRTWIAGLAGQARGAAALPADTVCGVPANPWAEDVRAIIGWRGAWRAYLDRLRPPLTIGHRRSLGGLVRARMGDRVADRLVEPLAQGRYGVAADRVDVEVAAPGLSTALTRTGSLAGAAAELVADDERRGTAGTARASLRGGMTTLVEALAARLLELGAELRVDSPVLRIERAAAEAPGVWNVVAALADADADADSDAADGTTTLSVDLVIVATPERSARELLAAAGCDLPAAEPATAPGGDRLDVVTLVVRAAALDEAPRGTEVLPLPGTATARSVTHATVAWPWLSEAIVDALGAHHHVVRVVLPATADSADLATLARREAEALLGVRLAAEDVRAAHHVTVEPAAPASVIGHRDTADDVRRAVAAAPALCVVGGWVAGSGLAAVTVDAIAEAERMRGRILWATQ